MRTTRTRDAYADGCEHVIEVVETTDMLEIRSPMPIGRRVFFGLIALVPLLAPYELLIRPGWYDMANAFFWFAAFVSLGAVSVSAFMAFAAVAGLETTMTFDARLATFTSSQRAPVVPLTVRRAPFSAIVDVAVERHVWSEGPDTFSLAVRVTGAPVVRTSSIESQVDVDALAERVRQLLGGSQTA